MNKSIAMNKPITSMILLLVIVFTSSCKMHKAENPKNWILNNELSSISITTIKNNNIAEVAEFETFSGKIDKSNYLVIEIDLESLETNIPIRNKRIQKHLFKTEVFPTADIKSQLKPENLTAGIHQIKFDVDLHGVSVILEAEFLVFEQNKHKIITLHKPLIVNAESFNLENGISTLKNIAKLQSIDFVVPVNIVLRFDLQ